MLALLHWQQNVPCALSKAFDHMFLLLVFLGKKFGLGFGKFGWAFWRCYKGLLLIFSILCSAGGGLELGRAGGVLLLCFSAAARAWRDGCCSNWRGHKGYKKTFARRHCSGVGFQAVFLSGLGWILDTPWELEAGGGKKGRQEGKEKEWVTCSFG
jgi:hypothetical protein